MTKQLQCPKCNSEFSTKKIIECSSIAWPELNWIYFTCPNCEKNTHILVEDGRICTVDFLGAPGPDWEINTEIIEEGITTRMDPGFAHVWFEGVHYEFEAKK